jgi:WD40 repeat protein
LSADGSAIAAGLRYGTVKVWDTATWQERFQIAAHKGDAWSVTYSPDGKTLITGGGDWNQPGQIKVCDAATGELRKTIEATGEVLSIAVSPTGDKLAAACGDKSVTIWDLP